MRERFSRFTLSITILLAGCTASTNVTEEVKTSPSVLEKTDWSTFASDADLPAHVPDEILIVTRKGKSIQNNSKVQDVATSQTSPLSSLANALQLTKAQETQDLLPLTQVKLKPGISIVTALRSLQDEEAIETIQPNFIYQMHATVNDEFFGKTGTWKANQKDLWNLFSVNVEKAWDITTGNGIIVAVLDSGIDTAHADLPKLWDAGGGSHGYNCVDSNTNIYDNSGHGTHVAGIIAAKGNNQIGISGVAYNATIMPVKVTNGAATSTTHTTRLVCGLTFARAHGADVINMSLGMVLGSSSANDNIFHTEIIRAYNDNIVLVSSAGNDGTEEPNQVPAKYDEVISVGSIDPDDTRSYFSNYGPKLDLMAPGGEDEFEDPQVISLMASTADDLPSSWQHMDGAGNKFVRLSGTSMAAPHVAAAAALIKSLKRDLTPTEVRELLISTATKIGGVQPGEFSEQYGYGKLNVGDAVKTLAKTIPSAPDILSEEAYNFAVGQETKVEIKVSDRNDDAFTVSVEGLPKGATFNAEDRTLTWNPDPKMKGQSFVIKISASDGTLSSQKEAKLNAVEASGGCASTSPTTPMLAFLLAFAVLSRRRSMHESRFS